MTRSQRRRHRLIWAAIGPALIVLIVAARLAAHGQGAAGASGVGVQR